jgi:F420-non-reducing hydrogenase iron-sulfur subunit
MREDYVPKVLGFLCNWCSYAGADLAGVGRLQMPATLRTVRVMCSSRVDPLLVLRAYLEGADGVLVAGCHPGDCHYERGNYVTRRRYVALKAILESLGLESGRVKLSWISASEGSRFADVVETFTNELIQAGRNPAHERIFI